MPVADALAYVHGTGTSSSGPLTSTAKSFTGSIAATTPTTGTLTVTAGAAGTQLLVGDLITGPGVAANTVVLAILSVTAANGVGTYMVSGSQLVAGEAMTAAPDLMGDQLLVGVTSQQSNLELDFEAPNAGTSYPWLRQSEVFGDGGVEMGLHIEITGPFYGAATLASIRFDVLSGAASQATTIIASRTLTLAQMQVQGAHYFIPISGFAVQQFLRWNATNAAAVDGFVGSIVSWFGPKTGGES